MFCREQVARIGDKLSDIRDAGADLYAIGSGAPHFAQAFKQDFNVAFALFTDEARASYRALGLKRDRLLLLKGATYKNASRAMSAGHRQGRVQGDAFQLGGTLVIAPDDTVRLLNVQTEAGGHVSPNAIVDALA